MKIPIHELSELSMSMLGDGEVIFDNQVITKREIHKRSNQLARYLQKIGVAKGTYVAVSLERSFELLISLLAIMKSGGVYLPLDPNYPQKRKDFILEDTQSTFLITQRNLPGNFPLVRKVLFLAECDEVTKENSDPLISCAEINDIAYAFYTSGSTGTPKGIIIPHAGLLNRLIWMKNHYSLTANDVILHKTPFVFDVSIWELLLPLITQAHLVIAPENIVHDPDALINLIKEKSISVIHFVPSMLNIFLENLDEKGIENCQTLRFVISSGESLLPPIQDRFFEKINASLYNLYGPTETSIDVTYWHCKKDSHYDFVPIGYPIDNCEIYIVDEKQNIVPEGQRGEIAIAGVGLARGYINQPSLTTSRFVSILVNGQSMRAYLSGDQGIKHPGGIIQYLGRNDHQVKIRGLRIELEEIESILLQKTREALVMPIDTKQKQLVGFITGYHGSIEELKSHLAEHLPSYMIPNVFVKKNALPLTISGKIDRQELMNQYDTQTHSMTCNGEVSSSLETQLLAVATTVLNIPYMNRDDDFFSLGGDSIIAIQFVSRARRLGLNFKVSDIFKYPTIANLASVVKATNEEKTIERDLSGDFPLTPIQHWFVNHSLQDYWNQSIHLQSSRCLNDAILKKTIDVLIHHHESLRLYYNPSKHKQFFGERSYTVSHQKNLDLVDFQKQIDPVKGPLIHFVLSESKRDLDIIMSHFLTDGISWRIFIEDFETVYTQIESNLPISLPHQTSSYKQWALALEDYAKNNVASKEISYWIETLKDIPSLESLSSGQIPWQQGEIWRSLTIQETRKLLFFSLPFYKVQINDVLLTALAEAISEWKKQSRVSINLEGHGRENIIPGIDISRTLGWFTSLYPVTFLIKDPNDHFNNLVLTHQNLQQIPNKGIGYGILKYLSQKNELLHLQEPDILFNYLGQWQTKGPLFDILGNPGFDDIGHSQYRSHLIEINGAVKNNCLEFALTYNMHHFNNESVEKLLEKFFRNLKILIAR